MQHIVLQNKELIEKLARYVLFNRLVEHILGPCFFENTVCCTSLNLIMPSLQVSYNNV